MDITLIISAVILLGCVIALSWFAGSDAPFVRTKEDILKKVLKFAGTKKGQTFYDLGSGDGRVVIEAAKLKANSIGIEQSIIRVFMSRFKARKSNLKNAKFLHENIFSHNFSDANVIYIYLLPKAVKKLEGKLKKELKKGTIIISKNYPFESWKAFKKIENFNLYRR